MNAVFANEGYCPCTTVNGYFGLAHRLFWNRIGPIVVYEQKEVERGIDLQRYNRIFGADVIYEYLFDAILDRDAEKVVIHLLEDNEELEIRMSEGVKAQLIAPWSSEFKIVMTSADYGVDVYVLDCQDCQEEQIAS